MDTGKTISLEYRKKWLSLLKDIVMKHVEADKYAVFLYGSAVNNLKKANDFDIGIIGKSRFPDNMKYLMKLKNQLFRLMLISRISQQQIRISKELL